MAKSLFIIIVLFTTTVACFSQSAASANISATITTPVGTSKLGDLAFENFNSNLLPGNINARPASINVTGNGYAYSVTGPSEQVTVKRNGGNETMIVESFYITQKASGDENNQLLAIGATLKVGASQLPGNYNSVEALTVTVNYN